MNHNMTSNSQKCRCDEGELARASRLIEAMSNPDLAALERLISKEWSCRYMRAYRELERGSSRKTEAT